MFGSQSLRVSDLDIPLFLLPHGFIANCNFCNRLIELEFTLNQLVNCPYCSMILNSPIDDETIISLMGGREMIKKHLDPINKSSFSPNFSSTTDLQKRINEDRKDFKKRLVNDPKQFKERLYCENEKFQQRLARESKQNKKGHVGGA